MQEDNQIPLESSGCDVELMQTEEMVSEVKQAGDSPNTWCINKVRERGIQAQLLKRERKIQGGLHVKGLGSISVDQKWSLGLTMEN